MNLSDVVTKQDLASMLGITVASVSTLVKNVEPHKFGRTFVYSLDAVKAQVLTEHRHITDFLGLTHPSDVVTVTEFMEALDD